MFGFFLSSFFSMNDCDGPSIQITDLYRLPTDFLSSHHHLSYIHFVDLLTNDNLKMKFFLIVLTIFYYILTQSTIHARTTGLRKTFWSLPTNGDYQGDLYHLKSDQRRQAGMFSIKYLFIFFILKFRLG